MSTRDNVCAKIRKRSVLCLLNRGVKTGVYYAYNVFEDGESYGGTSLSEILYTVCLLCISKKLLCTELIILGGLSVNWSRELVFYKVIATSFTLHSQLSTTDEESSRRAKMARASLAVSSEGQSGGVVVGMVQDHMMVAGRDIYIYPPSMPTWERQWSDPSALKKVINLPPKIEHFVGREDLLKRLNEKLKTDGSSAITQATACGLGGIGKTTLAIEYAHRYAGQYTMRWIINAETEISLNNGIINLSEQLEIPTHGKEISVIINKVNHFLEKHPVWLIIYDNVEDDELIKRYMPISGGSVLVTTRNEKAKNAVEVTPFSLEESQSYLSKIVPDSDQKKAEEIVEIVGGVPLVLEQASIYCQYYGFNSFLNRHETSPTYLQSKIDKNIWLKNLHSISQESSVAETFFKKCVLLAPDNIPLALLKQFAGGTPIYQLLPLFQKYSLMKANQGQFNIHRMVQTSVVLSLDKNEREQLLREVSKTIKEFLPYNKFDARSYTETQAWLPHIECIQAHCDQYGVWLEDIMLAKLDIVESMVYASQHVGEGEKKNIEDPEILMEALIEMAAKKGFLDMVTFLKNKREKQIERTEYATQSTFLHSDMEDKEAMISLKEKVDQSKKMFLLSATRDNVNQLLSNYCLIISHIIHYESDTISQALKYCWEAKKINANHEDTLMLTGIAYNKKGTIKEKSQKNSESETFYGEAKRYFEKSLRINPENQVAKSGFAISLFKLGETDFAISLFEELKQGEILIDADSWGMLFFSGNMQQLYQIFSPIELQREIVSLKEKIELGFAQNAHLELKEKDKELYYKKKTEEFEIEKEEAEHTIDDLRKEKERLYIILLGQQSVHHHYHAHVMTFGPNAHAIGSVVSHGGNAAGVNSGFQGETQSPVYTGEAQHHQTITQIQQDAS